MIPLSCTWACPIALRLLQVFARDCSSLPLFVFLLVCSFISNSIFYFQSSRATSLSCPLPPPAPSLSPGSLSLSFTFLLSLPTLLSISGDRQWGSGRGLGLSDAAWRGQGSCCSLQCAPAGGGSPWRGWQPGLCLTPHPEIYSVAIGMCPFSWASVSQLLVPSLVHSFTHSTNIH